MAAEEIYDVVGDAWYGLWTPTGGSGLALATFVAKFDPGFDTNTEGNTAAGFKLVTEQAIREMIKPKMTLAYRDSVPGAAVRAALAQLTKGILIWGPEGNGAGKPRWGAMLQVKKANPSSEVGKIIKLEVEFLNIGSELVHDPRLGDTF